MKKLIVFGITILCGATLCARPHGGHHHHGSKGVRLATDIVNLVGASINTAAAIVAPRPAVVAPPPPVVVAPPPRVVAPPPRPGRHHRPAPPPQRQYHGRGHHGGRR